ncbi:hypothetical protein SAMN06272759_1243 [Novosphingobium sp. B1]|nr:hypothetical protein SAMN06272759_1243 [Novosphingobium sp. B1]
MIRSITSMTLLMATAPSLADTYDVPTKLVLKVEAATKKDVQLGQKYASCMSTPWLPTVDQFEARARSCADLRKPRSSKLKRAIDWVDQIAVQFPGAEIELQILQR